MKLLTDIVRERAKLEHPALFFKGHSLSFADLDVRANQVARGLLAERIRPSSRVGILTTNCDTYFEILFGTWKARAVLVPVNHRLAAGEILTLLENAEVEILFVQAEFEALCRELAGRLPHLRKIVCFGHQDNDAYRSWLVAQSSVDPNLDVAPCDDILQIYTSGTTGTPKGACLTHSNYVAAIEAALTERYVRFSPQDRLLHCNPLFHVGGINFALYALSQGTGICLLDRADPSSILECIGTERTSHALFVPATLNALVQSPDVGEYDLSSMRSITYGASPISESLLQSVRKVFANASLTQGYGMTESSGTGTLLPPEDHEPARGKLRSCGRPAHGFEVRVVDRDGAIVPQGQPGEVELRSKTIMRGYWKNPEATHKAIEDGWLKTGDVGSMDQDGYLYLHDRLSDMIISGGENVYPAEVEGALAAHPAIADVAVIGIPSERWGEEPMAFVVLKPDAELSSDELISFGRERLAGYKVPKKLRLVEVLPRTASGKVLRRELRRPFWESK